jgi:formylglycine-generating enzyme required for sulfatase activity
MALMALMALMACTGNVHHAPPDGVPVADLQAPASDGAPAVDHPPVDTAAGPEDAKPKPDAPPPCVKDCVAMVWVPAGSFLMGAKSVPGESKPQHKVTLTKGFWIDRYEVSQKRYKQCMDDGVCPKPIGSFDPTLDRAVYGVKWKEAAAYCKWTGKRLPTEAEWERAACGDGVRCYPWGGTKIGGSDCSAKPDCSKAAHCLKSGCAGGPCYGKPVEVQKFEQAGNVSPYGAVNMAGNVWEWVQDPWTSSFDWCKGGCVDPVAKASTSAHVMKGGAWISEEVFLRCAARYHDGSGGFSPFEVGIRCAR